jgi:predicted esterase YcpF (UPF0227 family)
MSSVGTISHLLYLHGFRSSPKSFKARYMADWLQRHRPDVHWWCPQLPPSPRESMDLVFAEIGRWPAERMGVIGSSLYVTQLRVLTPREITHPERYLPVIARGDEVLDWREMSGRYTSAPMRLLDGGDHALTDFDQELPHILHFGLTD